MRVRTVGVPAALAGLLVGGGVAGAATRPPAAVKACVSSSGVLSLEKNGTCAKKTTLIKLSVIGPRGHTGATGPGGSPGAPGAAGAAGPSDVYSWSGTSILVSGAYNSPPLSVPAGSYVVSDAGLLSNVTLAIVSGNCNLSFDGAVDYVTIPASGQTSTAETRTVRAGHPFQVYVSCASADTFYAEQLSLTVTAVGTLHDNGTATTLP